MSSNVQKPGYPIHGFTSGSRLPQHKPADRESGGYKAQRDEIKKSLPTARSRIATKPGMTLREECVEQDGEGERAVSMERATRRWREWMKQYRAGASIFTNQESGEEVRAPLQNRFMQKRRERLYAQLKDLERGVGEQWGEALHTVMLTFTASTTSGAGDWQRCPGNHLDDLLSAWPAARRELRRVLDGREWEYVRVLEPHESGHGHAHVAVFVRGPVRAEEFSPVMEAHVNNCLPAGPEAHRVGPEGEGAVSVKRGMDSLAAYVSSYVGGWEEDPLEAEPHQQAFNALLWATNRRRVSFSQGCREMMDFEAPETSGEWALTHFERDGEVFPNNPQRVTEPYLTALGDDGGGLDPPPDRGGWMKS